MPEPQKNSTTEINGSHEAIFDPKSIAIVTGTFYPTWYEGDAKDPLSADKVRGDLALQSFKEAQRQNFNLSIIDGGSSEAFKKALGQNNFYFEMQKQKGGYSPARRQGIERAETLQGIKVIVQTEPEKVSVISDCIQPAILPILKNEADVVIPERDEESFSTYPKLQAQQEQKANKLYNAILRAHGLLKDNDPDLDFWFGQRFFANTPQLTELFKTTYQYRKDNTALDKKVNVEMYSNIQFFPVVEALYRELRVKSVLVPYRHPQIQTEFEEGNLDFDTKRHTQRRTIITELVNFIRYLEDSRKSRISKAK